MTIDLEQAAPGTADSTMQEAVVMLMPGAKTPAPADTRRAARAVLDSVQKQTGLAPQETAVFEQLHSFSVRAPGPFIRALSHADGVAKVVRNQLGQSPLIRPVKKRAIELPD